MPRKKLSNPEAILDKPIIVRLNTTTFKRLEALQKQSDCGSIGEVARKILSQEKINCFYRDISLHGPMEEMASIRRELRAIGININQQTKYFHTSHSDTERAFYVNKTFQLYKIVDDKVERLLAVISKLAEKWLQKL